MGFFFLCPVHKRDSAGFSPADHMLTREENASGRCPATADSGLLFLSEICGKSGENSKNMWLFQESYDTLIVRGNEKGCDGPRRGTRACLGEGEGACEWEETAGGIASALDTI